MRTPRIPLLDEVEAGAAAEAAGVPAYVTVLNVNRLLLRHPTLARNFVQYFWDLMYEGVLDPRLRELAILRIAWATGSEYEWTQHWHIAVGLGLPEDDLLAVRDWPGHAGFTPADRAALAVADDLVEHGAVRPATWDEVGTHLATEAERVELLAAAAGWRMVASLLLSLDVPLEDGVTGWPPDGVHP